MLNIIKYLILQVRSFFHEKRCILCTTSFIPALFTLDPQNFNIQKQSSFTVENTLKFLEIYNKEHIHSHICPYCAPYCLQQNTIPSSIATKQVGLRCDYDETSKIHLKDHNFTYVHHSQPHTLTIKRHSYCILCGEIFTHDKSLYTKQKLCAHCTQEPPEWNHFYFVNTYENTLRKLILNAKFYNSTTALSFLGKLLAYTWFIKQLEEALENENINTENYMKKTPLSLVTTLSLPDIIIPMPLHSFRLKERGYNQCILLTKYFFRECKLLFKKFQLPLDTLPSVNNNILMRKLYTQAQSDLTQKERRQNVKNVFQIEDRQSIQNKHILVIDDIATTNSTIKEATLCLKKAGASRVDILVIAKTPH